MTTIKCLQTTGDFDLTSGNIELISDLGEVIQTCEQTAKQQRGELELAKDRGIAYFDNVFLGTPNMQLFTAQLRDELLTVNNVKEVIILNVDQVEDRLEYLLTIDTVFGKGEVRGII